MITLENDFLKVSVRSKGAELTSIFNKLNSTEHLWQADSEVWGWHAPNLFPVVGGCLNNEIELDGIKYPMERHGFARHSEFDLIEATNVHAKFSLSYTEATLAVFPFKFAFQILYDLFDSKLRVSYKVINHDDKTIWFSIGAHPAFNVPFYKTENYEDYYIEFEQEEKLEKYLLSTEGYFSRKTEAVATDENKLPLTHDLFAKDALVFKNLSSEKVYLKNKKNPDFISLSYPHFNYLGLWAKPDTDFICIEPWLGCADTEGEMTDFKNKEAIHKVEHGHVYEVDFTIGINI